MLEAPNLSGFEMHNLQHSSASQINQYAEAPWMWTAQYLFNRRSAFGAAAKAGVLVEEAIVNVIAKGFTEGQAIESALNEYSRFTALRAIKSEVKRGEAMAGMIQQGIGELKQYGEPEFDGLDERGKLKQKKVEIFCNGNGWRLPIIGFLDLFYPLHGKIIDIKTTMKMPSEMTPSHRRQACIYKSTKDYSNYGVSFLYLTGGKSQLLNCPDTTETLAEIKSILNRQEEFLRSGDRETLKKETARHIPFEPSTFYHDATVVRELYGI